MSNKIRSLSSTQFSIFISSYRVLASGATLVRPKGYYPNEFKSLGINQRDSAKNDFWGTITTKPSENELVFGFVYFDKTEMEPNEDIYVVNLLKQYIQYFSKGAYEQKNPLYKGTHKGIKDFLKP